MPRSPSTGVSTLPTNSFNPAVDDTVISAPDWNATAGDLAAQLTHAPATTRALYPTAGQVQDGAVLWGGTAGGTANARTITLTPAITAYAAGQQFAFINGPDANSSATTLAVNGLTAANVFRASGGALAAGDIPANAIINVQYDGTNFRLAGQFADPTPSANRGIIAGLTLSNNTTDATNDIDIAEGVARSDDNTTDLTLSAGLTKQLDADWAAGTNAGMRDTGAISSGTWHIFLILNPTTGVTDILASLSATAPTMPSGFTKKRRIGSILRPSSTILAFTQRGNDFLLTVPIRDLASVSSSGSGAVTRTLSVPVGVNVIALIRVIMANGDAILVIPTTETSVAADTNNSTLNASGSVRASSNVAVWTNTSAQIVTRQQSGGPSDLLNIWTFGWTDLRGEFA